MYYPVQLLKPVQHANFPQATVLKYLPFSLSLSLWLSICEYAYAGKKASTLSHGPRARGLKLDPEWPLPIETSLQFSHWDPVTLPKIFKAFERESIELAKNSTRHIQQNHRTYRQVKSGLRVKRCLKSCFRVLNIKKSSILVSHCKACKICSDKQVCKQLDNLYLQDCFCLPT